MKNIGEVSISKAQKEEELAEVCAFSGLPLTHYTGAIEYRSGKRVQACSS